MNTPSSPDQPSANANANANAAEVDRRTFVKTLSAAGLGLAMGCAASGGGGGGDAAAASAAPTTRRAHGGPRRYAIVGTGSRHAMFRNAITKNYKDHAHLVALCDANPGRLELSRKRVVEALGGEGPKTYAPADFEKMIAETQPDVVIVTTVDGVHHEYMIRAMRAGCDVMTEKPMTTTAEKCQQILDTRSKTGRNCRVTFNYRYSPPRTQVKDILMSGEIGDILSVDFHWLLNTSHGADYFRRWHRQKKFSGGLMIHKATHHFDLVNWWLGAVPVSVYANGKREFYTPTMAKRMGLQGAHERCLTCPEKEKCGFFFDLKNNKGMKELYLDNEHHDGYWRDQCVWREDHDIEDTMNVIVKYDNNATLSYSLNAFNSWEGYHVAFNGTKGRLEHSDIEQLGDGGANAPFKEGVTTTIIPLRGAPKKIDPWTGTGGHGGGDTVLLDDLFLANPKPDKYLRAADERAGAYSILIGVAANKCFKTNEPVKVAELVKGLKKPDYAPMPSKDGPLPMPGKKNATA